MRGSSDRKINKQNVNNPPKKHNNKNSRDQIRFRSGWEVQIHRPANRPANRKRKEAEKRTRPINHPGEKAEALHQPASLSYTRESTDYV